MRENACLFKVSATCIGLRSSVTYHDPGVRARWTERIHFPRLARVLRTVWNTCVWDNRGMVKVLVLAYLAAAAFQAAYRATAADHYASSLATGTMLGSIFHIVSTAVLEFYM